jgi:hypothetical protein
LPPHALLGPDELDGRGPAHDPEGPRLRFPHRLCAGKGSLSRIGRDVPTSPCPRSSWVARDDAPYASPAPRRYPGQGLHQPRGRQSRRERNSPRQPSLLVSSTAAASVACRKFVDSSRLATSRLAGFRGRATGSLPNGLVFRPHPIPCLHPEPLRQAQGRLREGLPRRVGLSAGGSQAGGGVRSTTSPNAKDFFIELPKRDTLE